MRCPELLEWRTSAPGRATTVPRVRDIDVEPPRCVEMPSQAVDGWIARRRRNPTVLASRSSSPLRRRPFDRRGAREGDGTTSRRSTRGYITSPTPPSRLGHDRESGGGGRSYESPPPPPPTTPAVGTTYSGGGRAGGLEAGRAGRGGRGVTIVMLINAGTGTISKFPTSRFCWRCTRWIDCRGRVPDGQSGRGGDIRRRRFCFFSGTARIAPRPSSLADDPSPVAPPRRGRLDHRWSRRELRGGRRRRRRFVVRERCRRGLASLQRVVFEAAVRVRLSSTAATIATRGVGGMMPPITARATFSIAPQPRRGTDAYYRK